MGRPLELNRRKEERERLNEMIGVSAALRMTEIEVKTETASRAKVDRVELPLLLLLLHSILEVLLLLLLHLALLCPCDLIDQSRVLSLLGCCSLLLRRALLALRVDS